MNHPARILILLQFSHSLPSVLLAIVVAIEYARCARGERILRATAYGDFESNIPENLEGSK